METFVNPYSFVSFGTSMPAQKMTREDRYKSGEKLLSGWLDVELYTKMPLIIPDGAHVRYIDAAGNEVSNPAENQKKSLHKEMGFYKKDGKYCIPGSELRGMIRSLYEAATDSCVARLLNDDPVSHRVPLYSSLNKRALLTFEDGHWVLYKADVDRIPAPIRNNNIDLKEKTASVQKDGSILQYNIPCSLKNYHIAYLKKTDTIIHKWKNGDVSPYKQLRSALMRDGVENKNVDNEKQKWQRKALLASLEEAKKGNGRLVPVYYFAVNTDDGRDELIYMSGSAVGRIGQRRKWKEIIGAHTPCMGPKYCPACLLFGTINERGLKGRLRFMDAFLETEDGAALKKHTLDILAGPKTSAFEFYYDRPDGAKYWNADFYTSQVGTGRKAQTVFNNLQDATPRGRKMYWHCRSLAPDKKEREKTNISAYALASDKPFQFKIFFDGITETQLDDIIWVITVGNNTAGSNLQHKIGHAKPLGYGSVKLVVKKKNIRTLSCEDELVYDTCATNVEEEVKPGSIDLNNQSIRELVKLCDIRSTSGMQVEYPSPENTDKIFEWFANNRRNADAVRTLPKPLDREITLQKNSKGGNNKNTWFKRGQYRKGEA